MIEYNRSELGKSAKEYGFVRDTFEKVLRLKEILAFTNTDGYLNSHLALKGGTAINLTIFNIPRLSVDIDMDFTPNLPLEEMTDAREKIKKIITSYMADNGYTLSAASRYSHSLDAFMFQYRNAGGNMDMIKIEINYSLRSHIYTPVTRKIMTDAFHDSMEIWTLTPMEIFAAKANALMNRAAARDLYDFNNMNAFGLFDETEFEAFRKCIIFYASISAEVINKEFDTSAIDQISFTKIRRDLFPVLRKKDNFDLESRKSSAKKYIRELMVLTPEEKQYLKLFEAKEYRPELLFKDDEILNNIKTHPMALWKMQH
ncbi:MAG: nucleotidyl transferase AbiEii/AbiGii toxin family protein [Clostridiales bacterium]|nr:nucleotidyl transferase AbiEii/AbiGii toxin family protein [Clostridiales bacterium]